jgi:hypothetical protein
VERLTRRAAHAAHALLVAQSELRMPPTAQEVMLYDAEALSVQQTAGGLRAAKGEGLCWPVPPKYWTPTERAQCLRTELEDRFLRETEREGDE